MQKICYGLYRVSSKKQLYLSEGNKDDIPMQRQSCASLRSDGLEDRQRVDDETPFVLEWFVKHGIEVWSVTEGQQKIEQHVDKLMNYIRFWQAAGESEKTSIRTKTRLSQIVEQGYFRGGTPPFGYRLEKQGRVNKGKNEVNEILIDEQEATIVRLIFELYIMKGYGSQRIATTLHEQGVLNRKGNNFTNATINNMLSNRTYIGILKSGDTESPIFPHLQIIDPQTFEMAENLRSQRSAAYKERCVPLNTKGSSLLSGNIFCGHCGARMTITTNGKKYHRQDGEVTVTPRTRYVCYNRTRHAHLCDGQTGYTVRKLDAIIETVVHNLFEQLNDVPKDAVIAERYANQIAEYQMQLTTAKATLRACTAEVLEYEAEVIKIIRGDSKLNPDLLNKLYEDAKAKAADAEQSAKQLEDQIQDGEKMKDALSQQFDNLRTWADMYDECDMETKKMILARIMKSVRVRRGYEIEIDFTIDFEKVGGMLTWGLQENDPILLTESTQKLFHSEFPGVITG